MILSFVVPPTCFLAQHQILICYPDLNNVKIRFFISPWCEIHYSFIFELMVIGIFWAYQLLDPNFVTMDGLILLKAVSWEISIFCLSMWVLKVNLMVMHSFYQNQGVTLSIVYCLCCYINQMCNMKLDLMSWRSDHWICKVIHRVKVYLW